ASGWLIVSVVTHRDYVTGSPPSEAFSCGYGTLLSGWSGVHRDRGRERCRRRSRRVLPAAAGRVGIPAQLRRGVLDAAGHRRCVGRPQRRGPRGHGPTTVRDRDDRGRPCPAVDILHGGAIEVPPRHLWGRERDAGDRGAA